MSFSDGSKYVGEWKDDKRDGRGLYIFPNGTKQMGKFRDDKFMLSSEEGGREAKEQEKESGNKP
jgi:hypothetical protein